MTGLYPQNNGATEFKDIRSDVRTIPLILKNYGYETQIAGKVHHHTPESVYQWHQKYVSIKQVRFPKTTPYFILININWPHRPFVTSELKFNGDIPDFIPDTTRMRLELASYFLTLTKADNAVGEILKHANDDDLIILTSDHGASMPYLKGNCYGPSTNIPLIWKGPGIITKQDKDNLVSHVDLMPTLFDYLKIDCATDGFSYLASLKDGEKHSNTYVYSQLNRMLKSPLCRIRSISSNTHTYTINLDTHYPAEFVDGWGWQGVISQMGSRFFNRDFEEFHAYSKFSLIKSNELDIKLLMRQELIRFMRKFNDCELASIHRIF
jgi:arylsulfatase A-like enzyme